MNPANVRKKLFVLSDCHLGGQADDQDTGRLGSNICRSTGSLTAFIDWVACESREFDGITEIIINGDLVDFLTPDGYEAPVEWIGNEANTIRRLDRIVEISRGSSGRGPFEALRDFLEESNAELTVALGNHDVEIALPKVRKHLSQLFGSSSRFKMVYDGEPIVRGRVLIEHGNRYDAWNVINHSGLRQERSHLARGFSIPDEQRAKRFFQPPAGTLMVIYGINRILEKYPFINLLKPENEAAVPLLLALEPGLFSVMNLILGISPVRVSSALFHGRLANATTPARPANMGADSLVRELNSLPLVLRDLLGEEAALFPMPQAVSSMSGNAVLNRLDLLRSRSQEIAASAVASLDIRGLATDASSQMKFKILEVAFKALQGDRTFDLTHESSKYLQAAEAILETGQFDVVVFGHTHLPKRIRIQRDGYSDGVYINTGTWADTIRLPELVSEASPNGRLARKAFFTDMAEKKIDPYLFTSLGYAEIEVEGDAILTCELRSFTNKVQRAAPMTPYL